MALTKEIKVDKIEIVGDYKFVHVRTATIVKEDGIELSKSFHRHVIEPGGDISGEDAQVQAISHAVHTDAVIAAYQAHVAQQQV